MATMIEVKIDKEGKKTPHIDHPRFRNRLQTEVEKYINQAAFSKERISTNTKIPSKDQELLAILTWLYPALWWQKSGNYH
jgi:predicted XRE-type DNA-binding protein